MPFFPFTSDSFLPQRPKQELHGPAISIPSYKQILAAPWLGLSSHWVTPTSYLLGSPQPPGKGGVTSGRPQLQGALPQDTGYLRLQGENQDTAKLSQVYQLFAGEIFPLDLLTFTTQGPPSNALHLNPPSWGKRLGCRVSHGLCGPHPPWSHDTLMTGVVEASRVPENPTERKIWFLFVCFHLGRSFFECNGICKISRPHNKEVTQRIPHCPHPTPTHIENVFAHLCKEIQCQLHVWHV